MKVIKWNVTPQLRAESRGFSRVLEKLPRIVILNAKGIILKKINVSFIVHFWLANYILDTIFFKHALYIICLFVLLIIVLNYA